MTRVLATDRVFRHGHTSKIVLINANKTVADIKDTIRLSVNPPLRRDQLAIICVAKSISRAKQIIIPDTMESNTIDFSTNRLFVVLRLRAGGGSGGSGDTQRSPARDPPLPHVRDPASPQDPETSDKTIRAGSTDSGATQHFDYDSDMAPHHTAVDDTWASQHHSAREPILDSETSDRNKRSHDNSVNNRVQLCPAAVLAAVNRGNNMQAYCAAPAPYPSFEGEKQKVSRRAKDDVVRIKGRELSSDLNIDTLDNPTLARLLVSYQTPLAIKEGELVEPIGVRRNKTKTYLECRFIAPEQKADPGIHRDVKCSKRPAQRA